MKRHVCDRQFFALHPARRYRFRRPFPGELATLQCAPPPGFMGSILVEQFKPGVRVRIPIVHTEWPCSALRANETWLAGLADAMRSRNPNAADVTARIRAALAKARQP